MLRVPERTSAFGALVATVALLGALAAGCGGGGDDELRWDGRALEGASEAELVAQNANSRLGLGETRLSFAVLDDLGLVTDADVTARLYRLADDREANPTEATLFAEVQLTERALVTSTPHLHGDGSVHEHTGAASSFYTANTSFDTVGWWGAALDVTLDGKTYEGLQTVFFVAERTPEPMVGEAVPASVQPLASDVDDIAEIDSSLPPNPELHQITVADAISNGRPTLVAFVTPSFCQTQFCGPVMGEVIMPAYEAYGDRINFVHIEPFDLTKARAGAGLDPVAATAEWQLVAEPAVFVLDASGVVSAKFEGIMDLDEVSAALDEVLAGG
jgi:hypothetical protein